MPGRFPQISTEFASVVAGADSDIDVATAALVLAKEHYPRLDLRNYLDKLQSIADRIGFQGGRTAIDSILAINAVIFHEIGFHGNSIEYFDPRNSFLNEVIDRRTGIPITLSVVYMDIASRVGVELLGVGMPAHFLVKHPGNSREEEGEEIFIAPFNKGRMMDAAECKSLLSEVSGGRIEMKPEFLEAIPRKQILIRILANLFRIYAQGSDHIRALWAVDRILMIEPGLVQYLRDRGFLLSAMGKSREAILALEKYLKEAPLADDSGEVRKHLVTLKSRSASLN